MVTDGKGLYNKNKNKRKNSKLEVLHSNTTKMQFWRKLGLEGGFCVLIFVLVCCLYWNSLQGSFIWDDRAAVVKNNDVLGTNSVLDLFYHDFWGTDISRDDSHKSYRPLTVATFRVDHTINAMYAVANQWMSSTGARIAALLYSCHPVHVEAVASIVGRADSLCGLFFCLALYMYTLGVRVSKISPTALVGIMLTGLSVIAAILATLSKEIGFTVLGVFMVIEVVEILKEEILHSPYFRPLPSETSEGGVADGYFAKYSVSICTRTLLATLRSCLHSPAFLLRTIHLIGIAVLYFRMRAHLHGSSMVYRWTVMENHVHHLPGFYERALSYAQYHSLYLWKLIYPAQLCFDYGYDCVSTVHTLTDPANLRPLLAYCAVLGATLHAVYYFRVTLLVALTLLLIPLTPALNIFVPVGVLVAERLLFIPSIGFCILIAEYLTAELPGFWDFLTVDNVSYSTTAISISSIEERGTELKKDSVLATTQKEKKVTFDVHNCSSSSSKNKKNKKKATAVSTSPASSQMLSPTPAPRSEKLDPVVFSKTTRKRKKPATRYWQLILQCIAVVLTLGLYSMRVVSRNLDWHDEYSLYKSGLEVCPRSLKVLTNFALLSMARGDVEEGLQAALRAVEIYPAQVAALINAGVAYQKLGRYAESVDMFQRCLQEDAGMAKAAGYMGVSYYHWAAEQSDAAAGKMLRDEALAFLMRAIESGFQAPSILHLAGSVLIELNRQEDSIVYFDAALRQSANYAAYYQHKGVPILLEDDIHPINTLNQLGSAHWALRNVNEAIDAFERGLELEPQNIPLLTNLANLYREIGDLQRAREMMQRGIVYSGDWVPPALYNNLGLLELNAGNFAVSLELFKKALEMHTIETNSIGIDSSNVGTSVSVDGSQVESVIRNNIQRAEDGLQRG